jgi:hypothetical protein
MMLLAAGVAVWKGFQIHIHRGHGALLAFTLAALALAMAIWELTRRAPRRRM